MKDYRFLVENTLENMDLKISDFWLFEGITEFAKQFPKMSEEKLRKLIALDPTYKGGEQVGKYGNWIIRLFYNNLKNSEMMQQYRDFYTKNNGINPKTGKVIEKPELLPATPWEDADKLPNLLKQYDMLKSKIKKPITDFKSIPELYQAIDAITNEGVPQDKKAMERYYIFKNAEKKGLKIIYNDKDWIIGIPETFESSKMFGGVTNWCTTSSEGRYYNHYLNQYGGQYYILLDKETGELFQFHFESNQFMNEHDHQIDMYNFTREEPKICEFLNSYKNKMNKNISEEDVYNEKLDKMIKDFEEISSSTDKIKRQILYMNYVKELNIEGENITGQFDLNTLSPIVYSDGRDDISLETVCGILTDFYSNYDFGDMDLNSYSYQERDWNDIAEEYGIEKYNWDKICDIYREYNDIDEDIPEEICDIIRDDFYNDTGLLGFLHDCSYSGTEREAYDDIIKQFKDELPMTGPIVEDVDGLYADFKIDKDDLWKIFYVQTMHNDTDIPNLETVLNRKPKEKFEDPEQLSFLPEELKADWFKNWVKESDDEDYYGEHEDEDWLYIWRVINGKCRLDDGTYGSFAINEPYYGWDGFDDDYFKEGCTSAAKRIAEIVNKSSNEKEKTDSDIDKQISEVLRIAK